MVEKAPTTKKAKGKRKSEPCCHACDKPIEIGENWVIYHDYCDPRHIVDNLAAEIAAWVRESLLKLER